MSTQKKTKTNVQLKRELKRQKQFSDVISKLLIDFINMDVEDLDSQIEQALKHIGKFVGAERSYIFQLHDNGKRMSYTHEWCDKDIVPHRQYWQNLAVSKYPWLIKQLKSKGFINIQHVDDLPAEALSLERDLKKRNHESLIMVPMSDNGALIGFLGFADGDSVEWEDGSVPLLRVVGEIFANALQRSHITAKLLRHEEALRKRVQELNCLFAITKIAEDRSLLLEETMQEVVDTIPVAFEHASDICVRLTLFDETFVSTNFKETEYKLEQSLSMRIEEAGSLEVFYRSKHEERDIGPFQKEEYDLVQEIVEKIEDIYIERTSEKRIKELSELRGKFIHSISHELRTPLSAIRWSLEMLLDEDMGPLEKAQRALVNTAHEGIDQAVHRVTDLLRAVEIGEGRVSIEKELIDLQSVWAALEPDIRKECGIQSLKFTFAAPKEPLPMVLADPVMMHDVLRKLVENAIDYTPQKGSVTVRLKHVGDHVRFEVKDTGIGIPREQQPRIFRRFFRATNAFAHKTHASGVSLSIVKYYIEQHDGDVGFKSVEGKGSTFWIEVPVRKITSKHRRKKI